MANTDTAKQSHQQNPQEKDVNIERSHARSSGGTAVSNRRQYDPLAWSLMPGEMFNMNPFSLMRRLSDEMDRTFYGGERGTSRQGMWSPAIEVSEKDGNYVVCAELPGINKDNVHVEVTDNALVLHGERRSEHEENRGGFHRSERSYGEFRRMIPLPEGADAEQAKAEFKDGLLEIRMPMRQPQNRSRQIPIQGGTEKK